MSNKQLTIYLNCLFDYNKCITNRCEKSGNLFSHTIITEKYIFICKKRIRKLRPKHVPNLMRKYPFFLLPVALILSALVLNQQL